MLAQLQGSCQPGGTAADDQGGHMQGSHAFEGKGILHRRQGGQPVQRLDRHSGEHFGHAGLDRPAIRQHQALRTLPVGTVDALRGAVLGVAPEGVDAVGEEGRGDPLPGAGCQGLALPGELEEIPLVNVQDGVVCDAEIGHAGGS